MSTVIDCHAHIGINAHNLRAGIYPFEQTVDDLLHKMDLHNVSRAIVFPFPYSSILPSMSKLRYSEPSRSSFTKLYQKDNFILMYAAGQHPDRIIPFPIASPRDEKCVEHIKQLVVDAILGVKLHPVAFGYPIHLLLEHPLTKTIQDLNLRVVLHIGSGKEGSSSRGTTLEHALKLAKAHPSVRFIFCHLGRLHKDLPRILELENVLTDTSGLSLNNTSTAYLAPKLWQRLKHCEPRYVIEQLVEAGFEDKVLWGSDEPYTPYEEELDYVMNAHISESAQQKLLFKNIERFLRP